MTEKAKQERTAATPIPLTDIHVDHKWNPRGALWETKGGEEDLGFAGLYASIKERGLDEPVVVRPTPPDVKSKQKLMLVCGYRRFEAVSRIAAENGDKNPTILAVLRNLTEAEARAQNGRENTLRDSFTPPQLAWYIARLAETGANDVGIAGEIGKTQGYVSSLHRIMKECDQRITDHWRNSIVPLPYGKMLDVAGTCGKDDPKKYEKQNERYVELVKRQSEAKAERTEEEKEKAKIESLKAQAEKFGYILGQLDGMDFLDSGDLKFAECIDVIVKFPASGFDARKRKSVATAAEKGWKQAHDDIDAANASESEEEAEAAE